MILVSLFLGGFILSLDAFTVQREVQEPKNETVQTQLTPEDYQFIKKNARAICFETESSIYVDILRNTISGKLYARHMGTFYCLEKSDKSSYRYCFLYHGKKHYLNL